MKKYFQIVILACFVFAALQLTACDDNNKVSQTQNKAKNTFVEQDGDTDATAYGIEIPTTKSGCKEHIIQRTGYTLSYNPDWLIANWVAYEITPDEAKAHGERGSGFEADPDIVGRKATPRDYVHSGYDRGHLAPAADMKWSQKAMSETFYLSNICPQDHELNSGAWNDLEQAVRRWARREGPIWVCTGPIVGRTPKHVGRNRVAVPEQFFKAICRKRNGHYQGIAYVFRNQPTDRTFQEHAISIDSLETLTGHDFFPAVPDEEENRMERRTNSF